MSAISVVPAPVCGQRGRVVFSIYGQHAAPVVVFEHGEGSQSPRHVVGIGQQANLSRPEDNERKEKKKKIQSRKFISTSGREEKKRIDHFWIVA